MSYANADYGAMSADEILAEAERLRTLAQRRRRAERAERERRRKERMPSEPTVGSVVRFSKVNAGREYDYAARSFRIGTQRRWAVSNTVAGVEGRYTWTALLEFIGEANWPTLQVATDWKDLCPDEPPAVEKIGPYGRVTGTHEIVEDYHGRAGANPFGA